MGTLETGFGMAMKTLDGDLLLVKPVYGATESAPDFIQVTVGYCYPRSALFTDVALKDAIRAAKAQMMPDYDAIGRVERIQEGVSVFFMITKNKQE